MGDDVRCPPAATARGSGPALAARRSAIVIVLVALLAATTGTAALAQAPSPLDQVIERDQAIDTAPTVLADGHVDLGPRMVDGALTLMVHDDAQVPPVWRPFESVVLQVPDTAQRPMPDDPAYSFIGVEPGTPVHVVPQIQQPGVVWVGWNTQDPEVMDLIDLGVTLELLEVDGPGQLALFVQSGALGEPEVLWHPARTAPQPVWVEVNTHTHANWVFTEPGVYRVQVAVSAPLVDGSEVRDVRTLRFAVGGTASLEEAASAAPLPVTDVESAAAADEAGSTSSGSSVGPLLAIAGAAVVLVAVVALVLARSARTRRRADEERVRREGGDPR